MPDQVQKKHEVTAQQRADASDATLEDAQAASAAAQERVKDLLDDGILDEIDALLEENAQEFIAGYVQKGGE